jgi:hypothetical protein
MASGKINQKNLEKSLRAAWSKKTSWTKRFDPKNPAANQCRVTSAVVQKLLGGKILFCIIKKRPFISHFWNRLPNGKEIDFTRDQFSKSVIVPKGTLVSIKKVLSAPRIKKTYPLLLKTVRHYLKIS